jgi:Tfp pilus assembly protein PilF
VGSATESEALRRYVRAQVRRQEGVTRRAADDLDAALRLDPGSALLHRARADVAAELGDLPRATSEWEAALALDPRDPEAALAVGRAALDTGQVQRAAAVLAGAWRARADAEEPGAPGARRLGPAGEFALAESLVRALLRLECDEAALEPGRVALEVEPARLAAAQGTGLDAAARAVAALARDTGEAALRVGRWGLASELLDRSIELVPEPRAQALAAVAAIHANLPERARAVLARILEPEEPASDAQALTAEWILRQLGGDAAVAAELEARLERAPASGRIARLLAAAAPARAEEILDDAVAKGAVDRATLRAAFEAAGVERAVSLAVRTLRADPALVRGAARELARGAPSARALRAALEGAPESAEREALRACVAAFHRSPGAAWSIAEDARERWPDEPVVAFALVEAARASADPSLVQRATVDAPDILGSDAHWHAAIARAALAAGLGELAAASLARCDALDLGGDAAREVRSAAVGAASSWTPRGRAEQALARSDLREAQAALLEAHALEPDDEATVGILLRVLPRTLGGEGALSWADAEARRCPNDPLAWDALALVAVSQEKAGAALARVDTHLAGDPDCEAPNGAREALLRATDQPEAALVVARARVAALPPGPRRALEVGSVEAQAGNIPGALEALRAFAESAFPPPSSMRAAALDLLRRLPPTAERAGLLRRIARDAIIQDEGAPLEFFAFEALSAASDPTLDPALRVTSAGMIGQEAAASALHRRSEAVESWRGAADFLAAQGAPECAAEFLRARLDDPAGLEEADVQTLARAAFASDALAGGGSRAVEALHLLGKLRAEGFEPLGAPGPNPARPYTELAAIFTLAGDAEGSERILEAAAALDPDDPVAQNNLAYARAQRGLLDARTLDLARRAVEARPGDPAHLDTLGWVRYLRGEIADLPADPSTPGAAGEPGALTLLRRAVGRAGRNASGEVLLHLGDALWRSGEHDDAVKAWTAARTTARLLGREQAIETYRGVIRRQTGLGAVDPARFWEEHDGSVAERADARIDAARAGREPPVAPVRVGSKPASGERLK